MLALLVIFTLLLLQSYGFQLKSHKRYSTFQHQRLNGNQLYSYSINDFIDDNDKSKSEGIQLYFRSSNEKSSIVNSETIVLVDFTVRSFDDIEEFQDEEYRKLLTKCKSLKNDLSKDKFLYSYDLSLSDRKITSIARIPSEMYQKLDLCKRLSDLHSSSTITVYMLTGNSELIIDKAMCDAILSGFQLKSLASSMPNMKKRLTTDKKAKNEILAIEFVLPNNQDSYSNIKADVTISNMDRSVEDNLNYQIKDIPNVIDKISALEAAMLKATSTNIFNSDTDNSSSGIDGNNGNNQLESLPLFVRDAELKNYLNEIIVVNHGTHLTRQLASLPPNILNPSAYSLFLHSLTKKNNGKDWNLEEWDASALKDIGCGAFYAVTQADMNEPNRIGRLIRLSSYPATESSATKNSILTAQNTLSSISNLASSEAISKSDANMNKPIVLVGKGVCYDTGGVNLKSAGSMKGMKADMAGSATALSTFLVLQNTPLKDQYPIECWLAIAENNINTNAFRPDDVVYAVTGDSIEVVHTDAEGRMLLADTLALATRAVVNPIVHNKQTLEVTTPKIVIDFATLTGTCITSLSNRYIGAFTNRKEYLQTIIETGNQCGERVWPFPLDEDFEDDLKSDIADILQCRISTEADHIYAATFLKKFVKSNIPWIHLDLGSAYRPGGLAHVGTDFTGSGVRLAVNLIKSLCL